MRKAIAVLSAVSMTIGFGSAAFAQSISPQGSIQVRLYTDAYQTVSATGCVSAWMPATVSGRSITVHSTGYTLGTGFPCGNVTFQKDLVVSVGSGSPTAPITITDLETTSVAGSCEQVSTDTAPTGSFTEARTGSAAGTISGSGLFGIPTPCEFSVDFETDTDLDI